jgi:uncharacterized protein (TIGR00255 family)
MTGFARVRRAIEQGEISLSIKSVNHRGLDLHFHLPLEFDALESDIRAVLRSGMTRGHVQVHLTFTRSAAAAPGALNRPLFEAYLSALREAAAVYDIAAQPDINAALRIPGMLSIETNEELPAGVRQAVEELAAEALATLNAFREREGAAIAEELHVRCESLCAAVCRMEEIRTTAVPAFQKRLRDKLSDLLHGAALDPQRLAQEAALLAERSDIAEELVRLRMHAGQVDAMLKAGGEIGKRLDFLLQEMNRESNTILAKTGGLGDLGLTITELALAAKSDIEKIREQSLNLE